MADIWLESGWIGLELKIHILSIEACCFPAVPFMLVGEWSRGERIWHRISSFFFLRNMRKIPCFKMYLRFCFYYSGIVKPTGQEKIAIEKGIYYTLSPRGGCVSCHIMQVHTEMNGDWSKAEGSIGKHWSEFLLCFLHGRNGWGRVGSWAVLGLYNFNNLGRFSVVTSCPIAGLRAGG